MRELTRITNGILVPVDGCEVKRLGIDTRLILTVHGEGGLIAEVALDGVTAVESGGETFAVSASGGDLEDMPAIAEAVLWQTITSVTASDDGTLEIILGNAVVITTDTVEDATWSVVDNCGMRMEGLAGAISATPPDRDVPGTIAATLDPDGEVVMAPLSGELGKQWFSVRCIVSTSAGYMERVTVWRAVGADEAIAFAESEVDAYVEKDPAAQSTYLGLAQEFDIEDASLQPGTVVFSLMRQSDLDPEEYLSTFYDTGDEEYDAVDEEATDAAAV